MCQFDAVMFRIFRYIGLIEGVTTLALFLVAMPLKYVFDNPALVPITGLVHGWAFIIYIVTMVVALWGKGFSVGEWTRTTIASFFPFGTFLNDPFLGRKQAELAAVRSQ